MATNRGSHTCSNRGICDNGECICQTGFVASDGLAYGMEGGFRLRHDGLVSTAYNDCGALDQGIYPNLFQDIAAGENGGIEKYEDACPGNGINEIKCSGHGYCNGLTTQYTCICEIGWDSSYDCSIRTCPTGRAWFDFPNVNNEAHKVVQTCSGRGQCNEEFGICKCEAGYRGASCNIIDCPIGRVYHEKKSKHSRSNGDIGNDMKNPLHTFGEHIPEQPVFSDFERSLGYGGSSSSSGSDGKGGSGFTNLRGASHNTNPLSHKSEKNPSIQGGFNSISGGLINSGDEKEDKQLWRGSSLYELKEKREFEDYKDKQWSLPPPGVYCSGHGVCLSQAEHAKRAVDWKAETDISYGI